MGKNKETACDSLQYNGEFFQWVGTVDYHVWQ